MRIPRVVTAMNNLDDDLISNAIEYVPQKKLSWIKWGTLAACLCLIAVTAFALLMPAPEEPWGGPDTLLPPNFSLAGSTYIISPHLISFEELPQGFSETGEVEIKGIGMCSLFTNPNISEWCYVYHITQTNGETDANGVLINTEPHLAYVRYVDKRLRGKELLRVDDKMYVSMWTVNPDETANITWEYHNHIKEKYGVRIEGVLPEGFELAGTAEFSGYDSVPSGILAMNTDAAEVYLSKADPNIALVGTQWYTSLLGDIPHAGFNVYVLYDCPFTN